MWSMKCNRRTSATRLAVWLVTGDSLRWHLRRVLPILHQNRTAFSGWLGVPTLYIKVAGIPHSSRNFITRLTPPSNPEPMANSTCSITSLSDLLDKANTNLLNLTTVVASCPGVCSLIWGKGNPDLLGIGAMVSYMMQGVLALLCGPVIGFVYGRISNKSYRLRLSEITHFFLNTSAGFNIPVAIAAAFCMAQSTPFFDQSCMTALVGMQSVTFVCVLLISLTFEESRLSLNFPTIICYIALQPLLVFVVEALQTRSLSRWASESAVQLLEDCKSYSQIPSYVIPSVDKVILLHLARKINWNPFKVFDSAKEGRFLVVSRCLLRARTTYLCPVSF